MAGGDDEAVRADAGQHERLAAAQRGVVARAAGPALHEQRVEPRGAFSISEGEASLAAHHAGQPVRALRLRAGAFQQPAGEQDIGEIGLGAQAPAQPFHHGDEFHRAAAHPARLRAERQGEQAEFAEHQPVRRREALAVGALLLAIGEGRSIRRETGDQIADHPLFVIEIEVHASPIPVLRRRGRRPSWQAGSHPPDKGPGARTGYSDLG